jgi:hypothetical protein
MEQDRRTAHRHTTRVDTCLDCLRQGPITPTTVTDQAGGVSGGPKVRVLNIHPCPVWAYVLNEHNGHAGWVELDQPALIDLVDRDLTLGLS